MNLITILLVNSDGTTHRTLRNQTSAPAIWREPLETIARFIGYTGTQPIEQLMIQEWVMSINSSQAQTYIDRTPTSVYYRKSN